MKKHVMVIYILMIIVGLVGIVYYLQHSQNQIQVDNKSAVKTKVISVAIAQHDLKSNSIIKSDDYVIKSITVSENSNEIKYDVGNIDPAGWALRNKISANSYILPSILVEAGSDEYLSMFSEPGHVIYPFILDPKDEYLLAYGKKGSNIDIYLSFSISSNVEGKHKIISPTDDLKESRLKPLIYNKRILAVREEKIVNDTNSIIKEEKRHVLLIDLNDNELKILKNVEGKAKLVVFPSKSEVIQESEKSQQNDDVWPVTSESLFNEGTTGLLHDVNELRGSRE